MNEAISHRISLMKAAIATLVAILGIGISLANAASPGQTKTSQDYNWMAGGGG